MAFSSDEELVEALGNMQDDVFRVYIRGECSFCGQGRVFRNDKAVSVVKFDAFPGPVDPDNCSIFWSSHLGIYFALSRCFRVIQHG